MTPSVTAAGEANPPPRRPTPLRQPLAMPPLIASSAAEPAGSGADRTDPVMPTASGGVASRVVASRVSASGPAARLAPSAAPPTRAIQSFAGSAASASWAAVAPTRATGPRSIGQVPATRRRLADRAPRRRGITAGSIRSWAGAPWRVGISDVVTNNRPFRRRESGLTFGQVARVHPRRGMTPAVAANPGLTAMNDPARTFDSQRGSP